MMNYLLDHCGWFVVVAAAIATCSAGADMSANQCGGINTESEMAHMASVYQTLPDHGQGCRSTSLL